MSRLALILLVSIFASIAGVEGALAKEGVRAELASPIPADAPPGKNITVAWTLSSVEGAEREPFGADGIFIRLTGAPGAAPQEAEVDGSGSFVADVEVPVGGIEQVEIGLRGWRTAAGKPRESADMLFPISGQVLTESTPTGESAPGPAGLLLLAAGALAVGGGAWRFLTRRAARQRREPRPT
jgi:hypothetical protein